VPVLIVHGKSDESVPFAMAERTRDLLRANGNDVTFRSFEGGHEVPQDQLVVAVDWIREQEKRRK
jgi:predicted esterase